MKKLCVVFVILSGTLKAQSDLENLRFKLSNENYKHFYAVNKSNLVADEIDTLCVKKHYDKFWNYYNSLLKHTTANNKVISKVNFGFVGNFGEKSEIFKLNGGMNISKGTYPEEFELATLLNIQINNGKLQENLSSLSISYDKFIGSKNGKYPMLSEGYVFINRTSNQFMSVNQRYEIGGGIIVAHYSKPNGFLFFKKNKTDYDAFEKDKDFLKPDKYLVTQCDTCAEKDSCKIEFFKKIKAGDRDTFQTNVKYAQNAIRKKYAPLRLGVLFGLFYEGENISVTDSVVTLDTAMLVTNNFESTNRIRWEVRPTLRINFTQDAGISLKFKPYFKLPFWWDDKLMVDGVEKYDYRIEIPTTFSVKLSDSFTANVTHRYFYDNTPNSVLRPELNVLGNPIYLTAENEHHFLQFSVTYSF